MTVSWQSMGVVMLGGGLGSALRWLITLAMPTIFPMATLTVNILGCTMMGVLSEWITLRWHGSDLLRQFVMVGMLGGFTTFSSFALDTSHLYAKQDAVSLWGYVLASYGLTLAGFFCGSKAVRLWG